jgi:hypothetical protein
VPKLSHSHLCQRHDDTALPFLRQRLPHRRGRTFAHCAIQASAPGRSALEIRPSVIRRISSTYQRCCEWYIEAAFKNLKDDLQLRPIHHQLEHRIEAHIFVAFLAYCLHATLRAKLKPLAPGLTPRAVLDKLAAIQMLDVHFPTTDGRKLILSRYTELNADQKLLVKRLKLEMPSQPPPRITTPVGQTARAAIQHV